MKIFLGVVAVLLLIGVVFSVLPRNNESVQREVPASRWTALAVAKERDAQATREANRKHSVNLRATATANAIRRASETPTPVSTPKPKPTRTPVVAKLSTSSDPCEQLVDMAAEGIDATVPDATLAAELKAHMRRNAKSYSDAECRDALASVDNLIAVTSQSALPPTPVTDTANMWVYLSGEDLAANLKVEVRAGRPILAMKLKLYIPLTRGVVSCSNYKRIAKGETTPLFCGTRYYDTAKTLNHRDVTHMAGEIRPRRDKHVRCYQHESTETRTTLACEW